MIQEWRGFGKPQTVFGPARLPDRQVLSRISACPGICSFLALIERATSCLAAVGKPLGLDMQRSGQPLWFGRRASCHIYPSTQEIE